MSRGRGRADELKLSTDRKVSPRGYWQEGGVRRGRWLASTLNSFGLPPHTTCPGATQFCSSCYAINSMQSQGVAGLLNHNLRLLQAADGVSGMADLLAAMVARFRRQADTQHLTDAERVFRIHWSGDFFSIDYTLAWAEAIRSSPDVRFWAYTRSFTPPVDAVPILARLPNLALYLSVDRWNVDAAIDSRRRHPTIRLAYCDVDYAHARTLAVRAEASPVPLVCPENAERVPLMSNGRGACVECRLCPDARRDILFSTSHREHAEASRNRPTLGVLAAARGAENLGPCPRPGCTNDVIRRSRSGNPPTYCSRDCQVAMYRAQQRVGAR
jgi:hypothetical protein